MKRNAAWIAAIVLAAGSLGLGGCGSNAKNEDVPTDSGPAAAGVEQGNPWSEVGSADEAAKKAGLDAFALGNMEGLTVGELGGWTYHATDKIAQADGKIEGMKIDKQDADVTLSVRKAKAPEKSEPAELAQSLAGDYNEYAHSWTETAGDIQVTCFGEDEGTVTLAVWTNGEYAYSAAISGEISETDEDSNSVSITDVPVPLSGDDVRLIVAAVN